MSYTDPDYKREWSKAYKQTEAYKSYQRKYKATHRRLTKGKKEVVVKEEAVQAIWEAQGKACAICKKEIPLRDFHTHMDHDHETLQLRGVLCSNCNLGLGKFKDNIQSLLAAVEYLRRYQ